MNTSPVETRIVVVEDHALLAQSLALALQMEGYEVRCPDLTTTGDLTAAIVRLQPKVALVDLDLGPYRDGAELIGPLARIGTSVVVVTASRDHAVWGGCLQRGAAAVLDKCDPLDVLLATVRRVAVGLPAMSASERKALLDQWRVERQELDDLRARFARLTARERQVLGELAAGLTARDISSHDVVSEATVRTQVKSILTKLQVRSRLEAVTLAHQLGWQPLGRDARRAG
jgi:DNA-binding NarL/FixJ family response regulator